MWWRFIIFCFLVSFILFIVLNYLHDRPVVHFRFFKRDDLGENEQIVFERFKDNFLKERLVAFEFEADNGTFVPDDVDLDEIIEVMREKMNVHDPNHRKIVENFEEIAATTTEINEILDFDMANDTDSYFTSDKSILKRDEIESVIRTSDDLSEDFKDSDR